MLNCTILSDSEVYVSQMNFTHLHAQFLTNCLMYKRYYYPLIILPVIQNVERYR